MSGVLRTSQCWHSLKWGFEGKNSSSMATSLIDVDPKNFVSCFARMAWSAERTLISLPLRVNYCSTNGEPLFLSVSLNLSLKIHRVLFAACLSLDSTTVVNNTLRIVLPTLPLKQVNPSQRRSKSGNHTNSMGRNKSNQSIAVTETHVITAAKQVLQ